jgi:ATP-binding cassette, subfamily B, bacterial
MTSYYIIHAYLRDVRMHINNFQRSVNDMEELVAIHDEAVGIADAIDARAIDIMASPVMGVLLS